MAGLPAIQSFYDNEDVDARDKHTGMTRGEGGGSG